jgi:hypothetical protein
MIQRSIAYNYRGVNATLRLPLRKKSPLDPLKTPYNILSEIIFRQISLACGSPLNLTLVGI